MILHCELHASFGVKSGCALLVPIFCNMTEAVKKFRHAERQCSHEKIRKTVVLLTCLDDFI